jgi:hypothetical protein
VTRPGVLLAVELNVNPGDPRDQRQPMVHLHPVQPVSDHVGDLQGEELLLLAGTHGQSPDFQGSQRRRIQPIHCLLAPRPGQAVEVELAGGRDLIDPELEGRPGYISAGGAEG